MIDRNARHLTVSEHFEGRASLMPLKLKQLAKFDPEPMLELVGGGESSAMGSRKKVFRCW